MHVRSLLLQSLPWKELRFFLQEKIGVPFPFSCPKSWVTEYFIFLICSTLFLLTNENEISLYIVNTCSNIQVMRTKEVIAKDKMSWYLDKFSLLVPYEMYGEQLGEYAFL